MITPKKITAYRFGMTWGWVNKDRNFIFGRTIPLITILMHTKLNYFIKSNSTNTIKMSLFFFYIAKWLQKKAIHFFFSVSSKRTDEITRSDVIYICNIYPTKSLDKFPIWKNVLLKIHTHTESSLTGWFWLEYLKQTLYIFNVIVVAISLKQVSNLLLMSLCI